MIFNKISRLILKKLDKRMEKILSSGEIKLGDTTKYRLWKYYNKKLGIEQNREVREFFKIYRNPQKYIKNLSKDIVACKEAINKIPKVQPQPKPQVAKVIPEIKTKYQHFVACQGFYYSGSSTLIGLFREFDNVTVMGFPDYCYSVLDKSTEKGVNSEIKFFYCSKFFNFVDAFYFDNKLKQDVAIKAFIADIYKCYDKKCSAVSGEYNPKLYDDNFLSMSIQLLCSVVKFDKETLDFMAGKRFPHAYNSKDTIYEHCSFMRGSGIGQYLFYEFKEMDAEIFEKYIGDYIQSFLYQVSSKEFLVCDQIFYGHKLLMRINSYLKDNPIKQICVYRDPRDQFMSAFRCDIAHMPREIEGFVDFYLKSRGLEDDIMYPNEHRMMVRYEDIVLKYDETIAKILEFIGLDSSHHIAPKSMFDPALSAVNIGAYKDFIDQDFIKQIEDRLKDYCYYPEKENLSEEALSMLKGGNNG